jgi:voltage-gated potassium channel
MSETSAVKIDDQNERWIALRQLEEWIEIPMLVLSFVWFLLVLAGLVWGEGGLFEVFGTIIWIIFIADFLLRVVIAPDKLAYIRNNVIMLLALILPALRMFRVLQVFRILRAARGVRLLQIVGTANRSMNALRRSLGRRGLGYVLLVTLAVTLLGAAGMLVFESAREVKGGFETYADALWWTAMLLTTMGSGYWPVTAEGRVLAFLLAVYGIVIFGYITASFATFFIGQEAQDQDGDVAGVGDLASLRDEIAALRADILQRKD